MKKLIQMRKIILTLLIAVCFLQGKAQTLSPTVIATGGDYYSNSSGSLSWTTGESVVTYIGSGQTLSQGFQQSYTTITAVQNPVQDPYSISIYPNPVTDKLHLRIENNREDNYSIVLMDMLGKVHYTNKIGGSGIMHQDIDMQTLAQGTYFLYVYSQNKEYKITKIEHLH